MTETQRSDLLCHQLQLILLECVIKINWETLNLPNWKSSHFKICIYYCMCGTCAEVRKLGKQLSARGIRLRSLSLCVSDLVSPLYCWWPGTCHHRADQRQWAEPHLLSTVCSDVHLTCHSTVRDIKPTHQSLPCLWLKTGLNWAQWGQQNSPADNEPVGEPPPSSS